MRTSASRGLFFCHSESKRDGKYLWGSQILCKWPRPGEYFYLFLVWLTYIVKDFNFLYVRTFWPQLFTYNITSKIEFFAKWKWLPDVSYGCWRRVWNMDDTVCYFSLQQPSLFSNIFLLYKRLKPRSLLATTGFTWLGMTLDITQGYQYENLGSSWSTDYL